MYGLTICLIAFSYFTCIRSEYNRICCDGELGCFTNQKPFDKMPLPKCDHQVKMTIYTRDNFLDDRGMDVTTNIIPGVWKHTRQTVFIVHGLLESKYEEWMLEMKNEILMKDDVNLILVFWREGTSLLGYSQASSNVRIVAAKISVILNIMNIVGVSKYPYCIGFGLGSHVCGHLGMRSKLARITGLDPAGPMFETEDYAVGLNANCSDFVDVIHSHGVGKLSIVGNVGTLKPMGHVDFYPNAGAWQPGCKLDAYKKRGIIDGIIDKLFPENLSPICSHYRAVRFFIDSLKSENICSYVTQTMCEDAYKLPGSCNESESDVDIQSMGYSANKFSGRGKYYLKTTNKSPYCAI